MSHRQLTRHEREQRLRLVLVAGVALALVLVIAIPALGYYREVLTKGSQPVAIVGGQSITLDTFMKLYAYRSIALDAEIFQMQRLAGQSSPGQSSSQNPFQQQIQQLQAERTDLDNKVLEELIEQPLEATEATARGITISTADEDAFIAKEFGEAPAPTPAASPTAGEAATPGGSPVATPTVPVDPKQRMQAMLASVKVMTEAEYRQLVVRPTLLSQRLQDKFGEEVPSADLEVHARHILLKTEDEAKQVKERLARDESFEKLAAELSQDRSNKDKGGDLGWFGSGRMIKEFEDAAFALQPGQISDPVRSQFGWHVIQVIERDDHHPVDDARRIELRNKAFQDWLEKTKEAGFKNGTIVYGYSSDKLAWARNQIAKARGVMPAPS